MNGFAVGTHVAYLAVSVLVTVWVARTLHRNGRVFLIDAFRGREVLADSVNHLLVVGFYLINVGFVTLAITYGGRPGSWEQSVEMLSMKIGRVLVTLGAMHFFNMYILWQARKRHWVDEADKAKESKPAPIPTTNLLKGMAGKS